MKSILDIGASSLSGLTVGVQHIHSFEFLILSYNLQIDLMLMAIKYTLKLLSLSGSGRLGLSNFVVEPFKSVVDLVTFEKCLLDKNQSHLLILDDSDMVFKLLPVLDALLGQRPNDLLHPLPELGIVVILISLDVVLVTLNSFLQVLHSLGYHFVNLMP